MIDDQYIPYFITEEIFTVSEKHSKTDAVPTNEHTEEVKDDKLQEPQKTDVKPPDEQVHELAIWTPPLTSQDKVFLGKILNAINKELNSAFLMEGVNSYKPQFKTLLCFGYQKELELKAGKSVPLYTPVTIDNRTFLTAASPEDLTSDQKQKALLWEALQKMFL